jgi:hypothetical protein
MHEEITGTGPPGNRKAVLVRRLSHNQKSGRNYHPSEFSANGNIKQFKAEDLVRKFLASPVRYDRWIPPSLRILDRAQCELQHDGLAIAISAAEWNFIDLTVWQSYSAEFARAEAWKHIRIGIGWVRYLRGRRTPPDSAERGK